MSTTITPLFTDAGLAAVASATGAGLQAEIAEIAVGDAAYAPGASATALQSERARVSVSAGGATGPQEVLVEAMVPAGAPEFWIREVGFFLADGTLLAVWSDPEQTLGWRGGLAPWFFKFLLAWTSLPANSITVTFNGDAGHAALSLDLAQAEAKVIHTVEASGQTWSETDNAQLTQAIQGLAPTVPHATTEARGIVELATVEEARAGTDAQRAVTPSGLAAAVLPALDRPLGALPYPEIVTPDHRLTVTPSAAAAGGTVSVAAGTQVVMGDGDTTAGTGRLVTVETSAWTSADLAAGTWYLRGRVESGALVLYTQQGTDADATPVGLTGTPNAGAGGGFDSTVLDVLIAKIETGGGGTVPTVTALANAARLVAVVDIDAQVTDDGPVWALVAAGPVAWARTPTAAVGLAGMKCTGADFATTIDNHTINEIGVRASVDRTSWAAEVIYQDSRNNGGRAMITLTLEA